MAQGLTEGTHIESNLHPVPQVMKELPEQDSKRKKLKEDEYKLLASGIKTNITKNLKSVKSNKDPAFPEQKYCCFSFLPSSGATPDKDGTFGALKIRGAYSNEESADEHIEKLIRNTDSNSECIITYVGRWFPLTVESSYFEETKDIDIQKKITKSEKEAYEMQKQKEEKERRDIESRQAELLEESKSSEKYKSGNIDHYTTQRTKLAQLLSVRIEIEKKKSDIIKSISTTIEELKNEDKAHPEFKDQFMEKYKNGLKSAGIQAKDNLMIKFMAVDYNKLNLSDSKSNDLPLMPIVENSSGVSTSSISFTVSASEETKAVEPLQTAEELKKKLLIKRAFEEGCSSCSKQIKEFFVSGCKCEIIKCEKCSKDEGFKCDCVPLSK